MAERTKEAFNPPLGGLSFRTFLERCLDERWESLVLPARSPAAAWMRQACELGFAYEPTSTFDAQNQWVRFVPTPFLAAYVASYRGVAQTWPHETRPCSHCQARADEPRNRDRGCLVPTLVFSLGTDIVSCPICGRKTERAGRYERTP